MGNAVAFDPFGTMPTREQIAGALQVLAAALLAPRAATSPDDLVPLDDAARVAATSVRVLREAIRAGDLAAVGRQRDRAVKRGHLDKWIESRAVKPHEAIDDADIERRMRRLSANSR